MKENNSEKVDEIVEREKTLAAQIKDLETKAKALEKEYAELEKQKATLGEEQRKFLARRSELDSDFASKKAADAAKLEELKASKLADIESEISKLREKRLTAIADAENSERDRIRGEIAKEQKIWDEQKAAERKSLDAERADLAKERAAVEAIKKQNEITKAQNDQAAQSQKDQFDWQQGHIREQQENIESIIKERVEDKRREFDSILAAARATQHDLTSQILSQQKMLAMYDQIKAQLNGEDAAKVLRELNSARDELTRLRDELMTRPTEEMRLRYESQQKDLVEARAQIDRLTKERDSQKNEVEEVADLRFEVDRLNKENSRLNAKAESCDKARLEAEEELKRYQISHERKADRDARVKDIEMPRIPKEKIGEPPHCYNHDAIKKLESCGHRFKDEEEKAGVIGRDEMEWLSGIEKRCVDYGLVFPRRIIRSFHTALKTAEWSPLTILAGVSGTGKSELPKLYSRFGGLFFEPLPVQPNWDSKESILGFFNSIENKFEAQPLLKFLVQAQKQRSEVYSEGLKNCVCLVMLDEMNLAHPELYFAEFLSKLELRRAERGGGIPTLPVNIGIEPEYELPIGRNVLWTGTMNQDETTKSLSDKVLDRSIVISFPRPTELLRRKSLKQPGERGELLHIRDWQSWQVRNVEQAFSDDEIRPYRKMIEKINDSLGRVGRAIGHRVWQAIEYYMANYPTVAAAKRAQDDVARKEAMDTAFEDQIVQKIMPKLRGIDTRGTGAGPKCLSEIFGIIPDTLKPDFEFARDKDLSYGQFKWQTAKYLEEKSTDADDAEFEDSEEVK